MNSLKVNHLFTVQMGIKSNVKASLIQHANPQYRNKDSKTLSSHLSLTHTHKHTSLSHTHTHLNTPLSLSLSVFLCLSLSLSFSLSLNYFQFLFMSFMFATKQKQFSHDERKRKDVAFLHCCLSSIVRKKLIFLSWFKFCFIKNLK